MQALAYTNRTTTSSRWRGLSPQRISEIKMAVHRVCSVLALSDYADDVTQECLIAESLGKKRSAYYVLIDLVRRRMKRTRSKIREVELPLQLAAVDTNTFEQEQYLLSLCNEVKSKFWPSNSAHPTVFMLKVLDLMTNKEISLRVGLPEFRVAEIYLEVLKVVGLI